MEFLQVPETPAPQPVEPDISDCCGDEKIGEFKTRMQTFQWQRPNKINFLLYFHVFV